MTLADAEGETDDYLGSPSCLPCHPAQHETWRDSYHRTMTQHASVETAFGDFEDVTLYFDGRAYSLYRKGNELWVELSDPDGVDQAIEIARSGDVQGAQRYAAAIPTVNRRIVMTTGSHHYQLYWYPSGRGRELYMLPFAYLREDRRWVPRVSTFLTPPNQIEPRKVWNRDCLPCHSTAGRPRFKPGGRGEPDTFAAELGISCEACHGPAKEHAAANRNPLRRYQLHWSGDADDSVVHPLRLDGRRGAEVCGQCHSLHTNRDGESWAASFVDGSRYRPGTELAEEAFVVHRETVGESELMSGFVRDRPGILDEWFWPDGMIRVVGREYNGLVRSPCRADEDFTCMSCHSIHESDPDDQLKAGMRGDGACVQCHQEASWSSRDHTGHAAGSAGGRCMECHMPATSYGLLKASRSHTVTSPSVADEVATGRPNACNLCHQDQSLGWTAERLSEWYDIPPPSLDADQRELPAGAVWMLSGDAAVRAIAVWNAARPESQAASARGWQASVAAPLLADPYDAVRYVAGRALVQLPGFEGFQYDYLSPPEELIEAARRARAAGTAGDAGAIPAEVIERLLRQRDNRPVYIVE